MAPQTSPMVSAALATMQPKQEQQPAVPALSSALKTGILGKMVAASAAEVAPRKIELYSSEYYWTCALGGVASCGLTHMGVTPLDVVKCNIQTDPAKYKGISTGFRVLVSEQGAAGLFKGWVPTLLGYSAQGACKFGLYEYFKKTYADMAGEEMAKKYQSAIFLAGSASAEFFADIALCPFEAVKVKVQTVPGFAKGLSDGLPKFVAQEGWGGLFKGIKPLWGRQIPYTMMKFGAFENTVQAIYKYAMPKPKSECTKGEQLGVSFAAGYIAGVFCAIVSHPADNLVSKLNAQKGATVGDIVKEMGWYALFTRGLGLRIIMIGTLTGLQWGIYDAFKVAMGLPTTGSVEEKKK
uniref:Mitochondrial carrier protein CR057 n=2 Tax=Chlamydomonas incerta TaxID=51695 RepID=Q1WLX6_CHLIN|nr:mitochondrial carrier protein CR057 [Chlamydomonas incerta]